MLKQVTCARATIERAAGAQGIRLTSPGAGEDADVVVQQINDREVALAGRTLQGELFLSLLVCGAL